jgi:hypothetical protein
LHCWYFWQFAGCRVRKHVQRRSPKKMEGLLLCCCSLIVDSIAVVGTFARLSLRARVSS